MANVILGFPNQVDAAYYPVAFSGGSWQAALPLANLRDPQLAKIARSTAATLASTQFDVDLGVARPIRLFVLPHHTISRMGRVRIRGGNQAAGDMTGRRNMLEHTQNFPDPAWAKGSNAQHVGGGYQDPDGTNFAHRYKTTATGNAFLWQLETGLTPGDTWTASFYNRVASGTLTGGYILLRWLDSAGNEVATSIVNFSNALQGTQAPTRGNFNNSIAWGRSYITATVPAGADRAQPHLITDWDAGVELDFYGAQFEKASSETAYQRVDTTSDFLDPVYDTGWLDAWTVIYAQGSLPWGHPSFWDGKMSQEDAADYTQDFIHVATGEKQARYWRWEIDDTGNSAGYVDLARLFMSPGWQPTINMDYGASLGVLTDTSAERSLGGVDYYDRHDPRRVVRFMISNLDENIALSQPFEMQRILGLDRQLYFIYDPDDTANLHRRSFLATMRELSEIEFPYFERASAAFQLQEVL